MDLDREEDETQQPLLSSKYEPNAFFIHIKNKNNVGPNVHAIWAQPSSQPLDHKPNKSN